MIIEEGAQQPPGQSEAVRREAVLGGARLVVARADPPSQLGATGVILQVSRAAGETAPIMFTGAVFYRRIAEGDLFAYNLTDQCMALSMHLFTVSTQVTGAPEALPYAVALVLLGSVLLVNATAITLRAWLRSRKKW